MTGTRVGEGRGIVGEGSGLGDTRGVDEGPGVMEVIGKVAEGLKLVGIPGDAGVVCKMVGVA